MTRLGVSKVKFRHILIFIILTIFVLMSYIIANGLISKKPIMWFYNKDWSSDNEFLKTVDCAPIIDKYGCDGKKYKVSFDIMSEKSGSVQVYLQNGFGSKYNFQAYVSSEEDCFTHYELEVAPTNLDKELKQSFLAFYGEYGSGVIPHVTHIRFEPIIE